MAMLAEPRRKQKWTLNPRGKHWSEDTNKFGQKMLEKMGWTSGKGLGAKEQGMTDHIRVSYKDDTSGIGFKKDDLDKAWTENHEGFNDLLQQLQKCQTSVAAEVPEVKTEALSGKSLELKSKQSRARVHYRKFTRGKDVNRYSSKDLANIFGKKELNENSSTKEEEPEQENSPEVIGTQENRGGVITIYSGSMADYFKNKGHDFSKLAKSNRDDKVSDSESEVEYAGFGFSKTPKKNETEVYEEIQTPSSYAFENPCLRINSPEDTSTNTIKVSKKRKNDDHDNNESSLTNYAKKVKESCGVEDSYKQCFVNPALNLESLSDEVINGKEFEVSRAQFGVSNSALDLTDESNEKKRVTFNDHVEYSTDPVKKKKGKATLDKFEVENKKGKKKRKHNEDTNNAVAAGFVNEAMDLEDVSEEINDNEVNERKSKKSKKRKGSRASILETIIETPEEDKAVEERTDTDDAVGTTQNDALAPETALSNKETKKKKKKKKKSERDSVEDADDKVSSVNSEIADAIDDAKSTTQIEEVLPSEAVDDQENGQSRDKKKKKKKNKTPSDSETQETAVADSPMQEVKEVEVVADQKKKKKKHKSDKGVINNGSEDVKQEKEISDKENTNTDQEDASKETKRKKNKKSRKSTEEHIENNAAPVIETVKDNEKANEQLEDATTDASFKKSKESIESPRTPRSPWNEKARMSKKLLKSLFQRNFVQTFPGSNIDEIKGYGADV